MANEHWAYEISNMRNRKVASCWFTQDDPPDLATIVKIVQGKIIHMIRHKHHPQLTATIFPIQGNTLNGLRITAHNKLTFTSEVLEPDPPSEDVGLGFDE